MKMILNKVCEFFSKLNTAFDNSADGFVSKFAKSKLKLVFISIFACGMVGIAGSNIAMCIVGYFIHSDTTYKLISTLLSLLGIFVIWKCLYYARHACWYLVRS